MIAPSPLSFSSFFPSTEVEIEPQSALPDYDRGFEDGRTSAQSQSARLLTAGLDQLEETITKLCQTIEHRFSALETAGVHLSLHAARLIAAGIAPPEKLVETTICNAMADLKPVVQITIHVAPELHETISQHLNHVFFNATSNIHLLVDPSLKPGDCRIDWVDGAIERRIDDIEKKIAAALALTLSTRTSPATDVTDEADEHPALTD